MNESNSQSITLKVPHFENKPCYNCGSLDRGISNFFDEMFIIHCHSCNVTIARGFFNAESCEVFDSEPDDTCEIDMVKEVLENTQ